MRKLGWGVTLGVMGLVLASAAVPANAAYVLNMTAVQANANPGATVQVQAVLVGTGPIDSFLMDVPIQLGNGAPNLVYVGYLLAPEFQTGSGDDFSVPKGALDTGRLPPDFQAPVNVHLEALTRTTTPPTVFNAGTLATLDFRIPDNAVPGQTYSFQPLPDTFALGLDVVDTTAGTTAMITVVPEPATLLLLAVGGLAAARRRLFSA